MKVIWGGHFSSKEVSAETAHQEIVRLGGDDGKCTAEALLNASRDKDAPLHNLFEWDDGIAAELYRTEQARLIIRSVYVVEDEEEEKATPIRAFFHVDNSTHDYEPTVIIMKNDDKREALLKIALTELRRFREKYHNLKEFLGVFKEIDKLDMTLTRK